MRKTYIHQMKIPNVTSILYKSLTFLIKDKEKEKE